MALKQFLFGALMAVAAAAQAQEAYPAREIELVIPWGPGGVSDLVGRVFAAELSKTLGVPVVVLNKPGASGTLGGAYVARGRKDGHTLMLGSLGWLVGSLLLDIQYDPIADFVPIMRASATPQSIFVKSESPIGSLEDLLARAKRAPGTVSAGTGGVASDANFALQVLQKAAAVQFNIVPFKSGNETPSAVLGGHVDFGIGVLSAPIAMVRAGSLRVLAISGVKRVAELPDVPTLGERGYAQTYLDNWNGLMAPAGIPQPVAARLIAASEKVMRAPEVISGIEKNASVADPAPGAQFLARLQSERKIIEAIAADLRLKPAR